MASTRGHDLALSDEIGGDGYGLIQQAAWVVAKIENKCPQLTAYLLLERLDCSFHRRVGLLLVNSAKCT